MKTKSMVLLAIDGSLMIVGLAILLLRQYPECDYTVLYWAAGAIGASFLAQGFIIRSNYTRDCWLLPMVMFLASIGVVMLGRLKPVLCIPQLRWLIIGLVVLVAVLRLSPKIRELMKYQYILGILTLIVLCLSLLFGTEIGGSKNWLVLGPFQVQPSEFGRILLVLFLAAYLSDHREVMLEAKRKFGLLRLPPLRFIAPLLCIWGMAILMFVVQRDLGSALLFFCMAVFMTYMATGSKSYVFIALSFFALGAFISYELFGHVRVRFDIWLDPWEDPAGQAYQVVQSLFAFAAGGTWGTGLTHGHPGLIPEVHTDFIFSAIGEELGLLGCTAVMLAYTLFFYRGIRIALGCRRDLYMLIAAGIAIGFYLQAFIIIAGVTKFLPLTGITLPFVSYGGSSMVSGFIMLGLLMAMAQRSSYGK